MDTQKMTGRTAPMTARTTSGPPSRQAAASWRPPTLTEHIRAKYDRQARNARLRYERGTDMP